MTLDMIISKKKNLNQYLGVDWTINEAVFCYSNVLFNKLNKQLILTPLLVRKLI